MANRKVVTSYLTSVFGIILGGIIAAFAIEVLFIPNSLIDGGIVGLAMIGSKILGGKYLPLLLILFNFPFAVMAYKHLGKRFVAQIILANASFSGALVFMPYIFPTAFIGDPLEVVVIGGAALGVGIGIIIRYGGCIDGTEILGIIINKRKGFTVGQTVFTCNIFIFTLAGFVFKDWHPPILSLIAYIVVMKVMDTVIVGLDEIKAVLVISNKSQEVSHAIMHELGLGLTILYGRGGYSGASVEVLYVITDRVQLANLKEIVCRIDSKAFIAISNLHEMPPGMQGKSRLIKGNKHIIKGT